MGEAEQKKGLCARKCSSVNRAHVSPRTRAYTRTEIGRESDGKRRQREKQERHLSEHRHPHTDTPPTPRHRDIQQLTPTPRQPLKLPGFAFRHCDPAVREQPTGTQADLSSRSLGHHFWGNSPAQRPRTPEAGIPRCLSAIRLTFLPP